jgi:hypothetical protein
MEEMEYGVLQMQERPLNIEDAYSNLLSFRSKLLGLDVFYEAGTFVQQKKLHFFKSNWCKELSMIPLLNINVTLMVLNPKLQAIQMRNMLTTFILLCIDDESSPMDLDFEPSTIFEGFLFI